MIQLATYLKYRIARFLNVPPHSIESIQSWFRVLFVKFRKGSTRFVSKISLSGKLPTSDGLYWLQKLGRKLLVRVEIFAEGSFNLIDPNSKALIGFIETVAGKVWRGFWGSDRFGRAELQDLDFEPYNVAGYSRPRGTGKPTLWA